MVYRAADSLGDDFGREKILDVCHKASTGLASVQEDFSHISSLVAKLESQCQPVADPAGELPASPAGATEAEHWMEATILQVYEDLSDLVRAEAASTLTPTWSDHRRTLRWVVRKLERLRLRLLRREISPQVLCSVRPRLEDTLQSLRAAHCLCQDEVDFLDSLAGDDADDSELDGFSDEGE